MPGLGIIPTHKKATISHFWWLEAMAASSLSTSPVWGEIQ
jgi:hypothetical protein